MATNWDTMTDEQRISAVHFDIMRNADFALLSGVVMMGDVKFSDTLPTAATDGRDCIYGRKFLRVQNRPQTRYIVLHENFHKGLRHCTAYKDAFKRAPQLANKAADYVVNGLIEQADPDFKFVERPANCKPLVDPKYFDMSFPRVFMDLLKQCEGQGGRGKGIGDGEPMDEHIEGTLDAEAQDKLDEEIKDALYHGNILSKALKERSAEGTGGKLDLGDVMERKTNWKEQLRDFVSNILRGNDVAKWSRINNRIFSATNRQVLLPTLYNESVGQIVIAADTSGSMGGLYPLLFGEVARVVEDTTPEKVTLIWWDTRVANVQEFTPANYSNIRSAMSPAGGGGTNAQCVVDYINKKQLKPQCVIFLTDGYIGTEPTGLQVPSLWGVVDNEQWFAKSGKTMHISSMGQCY